MQYAAALRSLKPHWFHILLALADQELHGFQIVEAVTDCTDGSVRLWPSKLRGALKAMRELHLVEERGWSGPHTWTITDSGRETLKAEVERMSRCLEAARERLA